MGTLNPKATQLKQCSWIVPDFGLGCAEHKPWHKKIELGHSP